jgi:hypothetical protein
MVHTSFLPALAALTLASAALGQFTAISLHPAGATESQGLGIGLTPTGVRQVGAATISSASHAAMWSGTPGSFVDLNPAGAGSVAYAISGTMQVGTTFAGSITVATTWTGSAATWTNISGGSNSIAYAVDDGLVGGTFSVGPTTSAACQWLNGVRTQLSGTSLTGIDNGVRVGTQRTGSFPLYSSAAFLIPSGTFTTSNLHPVGAHGSGAAGVSGSQQVGFVRASLATGNHAALWNGSPAWIDLHPPGPDNTTSECTSISNGAQAGFVMIINRADPNLNSVSRAAFWRGTPASWINLHSLLPGGAALWANSRANGIYDDGTTTIIVGTAFNLTNNRSEAVLWTSLPPAPPCGTSDFNGDGDFGTDADIEAFFACLAGTCCPTCYEGGSDFNADGDFGTDADIESFFRVLGGGSC